MEDPSTIVAVNDGSEDENVRQDSIVRSFRQTPLAIFYNHSGMPTRSP